MKFDKVIIISSSKRGDYVFQRLSNKYNCSLINDTKLIQKKDIYKNSLLVIAGFNKIIKTSLLNKFKFSFNLHGGKLPNYRGASVINWQILNGEKFIYLSSLKVTEILDGGDIILEKKIKINGKSYDELINKIDISFASLAEITIKKISKKTNFRKQRGIPTYWHKRKPEMSLIDPEKMNLNQATCLLNASSVNEKYPAYLFINKKKIFIKKLLKTNFLFKGMPGVIYKFQNKKIIIFKNNECAEFEEI